jgi:hypothetical protein
MVVKLPSYTVIILFSDYTERSYDCHSVDRAFDFFDVIKDNIEFQEKYGKKGPPPYFESVRLRFNPFMLDLRYYPTRH